jgi:hypothetical protein
MPGSDELAGHRFRKLILPRNVSDQRRKLMLKYLASEAAHSLGRVADDRQSRAWQANPTSPVSSCAATGPAVAVQIAATASVEAKPRLNLLSITQPLSD